MSFVLADTELAFADYGSIIWETLGFSTVQILHFQCGFQLTGLVFNVLAMTFVDSVKRPTLIASGFLITSAVVATEMALQRYYVGTENRAGLIACATLIFLFQTTYSLFLDGPTFFYVAEIWPNHLRSQGFSIAIATMCLTCLTWLQAAPSAFAAISWQFYLFFVILPAAGAIVVIFWFVDTLHKPLEEIAALFGDEDMIAVYQQQLTLDTVVANELADAQIAEKGPNVQQRENVQTSS